jgi:RimJ/RimL family protein N-acetyltransferase
LNVVGAERVISLIGPDNEPSIRAAERLGERYERTIDRHRAAAHISAIGSRSL